MIEGKNYPDAKVVKENALKPHPDKPLKDYPILLGVISAAGRKRAGGGVKKRGRPRRERKRKTVALFLIERKKPKDRIQNLIQSSVSILNNSRALFYDQILELLNICSLQGIEPAYTDTG